MGAYSQWEATDSDIEILKSSMSGQAKSFGVDVEADSFKAFLAHTALVRATEWAEKRFLQNILHPENDGKLQKLLKDLKESE